MVVHKIYRNKEKSLIAICKQTELCLAPQAKSFFLPRTLTQQGMHALA